MERAFIFASSILLSVNLYAANQGDLWQMQQEQQQTISNQVARRDHDDDTRIMRNYENQQDPSYRFRNYRDPDSYERQAYLNGQIIAPREYPPPLNPLAALFTIIHSRSMATTIIIMLQVQVIKLVSLF